MHSNNIKKSDTSYAKLRVINHLLNAKEPNTITPLLFLPLLLFIISGNRRTLALISERMLVL